MLDGVRSLPLCSARAGRRSFPPSLLLCARAGEPKKAKDARKALTLDVDTIVICAGQDPLDALKHELKDAGVRAFVIGGAERAGELDAKRAIDQVPF